VIAKAPSSPALPVNNEPVRETRVGNTRFLQAYPTFLTLWRQELPNPLPGFRQSPGRTVGRPPKTQTGAGPRRRPCPAWAAFTCSLRTSGNRWSYPACTGTFGDWKVDRRDSPESTRRSKAALPAELEALAAEELPSAHRNWRRSAVGTRCQSWKEWKTRPAGARRKDLLFTSGLSVVGNMEEALVGIPRGWLLNQK
jgi:hypothetical protein